MWVPEANHPRERLILAHATIVRTRHWQGRGTTVVTVGQMVQATDPIAEVAGTSDIRLVEGASALGVAPAQVRRHLQVEIGAEVREGEVIARKGGLFRRSLAAPVTGTLLHVDDTRGIILIRTTSTVTPVNALLRGEVFAVHDNESVEITSQGALIQGMWGNGRANAGTTRLLVSAPGDSANAALINPGLRGTVVVVGATADRALLERAQAVGVVGLIAGSMDGSLLSLAQSVSYPMVLTEGFGTLPINAPSFKLLAELNGREATVGVLSHKVGVPEIVVARGGAARPLYPAGALAAGDRVRLLGAPYVGQLGTIGESADKRVTLPSRVTATVCTVQLDEGGAVQVPYGNVERLVE
jgi:hypothetical protein